MQPDNPWSSQLNSRVHRGDGFQCKKEKKAIIPNSDHPRIYVKPHLYWCHLQKFPGPRFPATPIAPRGPGVGGAELRRRSSPAPPAHSRAPPRPPVGGDKPARLRKRLPRAPLTCPGGETCREKSRWTFPAGYGAGALRRRAQLSWEMSAAGRAEPLGPPSSFAKRLLVTGGAGFM